MNVHDMIRHVMPSNRNDGLRRQVLWISVSMKQSRKNRLKSAALLPISVEPGKTECAVEGKKISGMT